jgi:hypothetical protein
MSRKLAIGRLTAVLGCSVALWAQVPDEAQKAAVTWLATDCDVGENEALDTMLAKHKTPLEPVFLQALAQGPDTQKIAAAQAAAARQFQRRQEALKTGKGLGLSDADLKAARAVTSEQYMAHQKDDFILRYKSRAVAALGIVAGELGKAKLRALAAEDSQSPLRSTAQAALSRLDPQYGRSSKK